MKACTHCGGAIESNRNKKFCSKSCANIWNGLRTAERNKDEGEWKQCASCGELKPKNAYSFVDKINYASGRRAICKSCSRNIAEKERRDRTWKHKAALVLLNGSKQRAKRAGLEHTLTIADIVIPDVCPVFGFKLAREGRATWNCAPSIDRIDNSKGYTSDNTVIVSRRANIMKKDSTIEELKLLAKFYGKFI